MKFLNTKLKKTFFWAIITILIIVILVIAFISPIAKYLVEKYDVKYSGREITMDWVYINPFTGHAHIHNLKIHEYQSDSVFFAAKGVTTDLEMHKLLSKNYELSEVTLDEPVIHIVQDHKEFNFDDLIKKFSPKDTLPKAAKAPTHFNALNLKINNGTFYYHERSIPVYYYIKKVDIESGGKRWDVDSMDVKYAFESGIGTGTVKGNAIINTSTLNYRLAALVDKFDLSVLEQYLKDIANYGSFRANLDADVIATGNFKKSEQLNATGIVAINDFHFGKTKEEDYASFKKFTVRIKQLSPVNKKYMFDSLSLLDLYAKYERYDHLDNLQNMFGKKGQKVSDAKAVHNDNNILFQIADYVKLLAKNFFRSNYKIGRLAIYNANLRYNDFALMEEFSAAADPLTITADSIDRTSSNWVDLNLHTGIKPYGDISLGLSINPQDSSDFNLQYHLQRLPVAMFNPYLITYTSFPLDRGTLELKGHWNVNNGVISSENHLLIIDPRINKKQKHDGDRWIPMRVVMFFVRDRGNVIDYQLPISGDLKNPKFHLRGVILDILKNVFVKPPTTPYRMEVRNIETDIEKSLSIKWDMRSSELQPGQEDFLEDIASYLKDNPSLSIGVHPIWYVQKEKEYIAFFEAKKRFYLSYNKIDPKQMTKDDTVNIDRMSVKDSSFIKYLDRKVGTDGLFTVQSKCVKLIGQKTIDAQFERLCKARQKVFMAYFKEAGVENRVHLEGSIDKVPYNGFSLYRIDYKGQIPDELKEAYERIHDLDNEAPRNKFKRLRDKYRKELRNRK